MNDTATTEIYTLSRRDALPIDLRSIGKLAVVPSMFNINEPVIFGSPVVMNPLLFIPFITAPLVNATLAYIALKTDLVHRVISLAPWTTPGPIGAAWSTGWESTRLNSSHTDISRMPSSA